MKHQAAHEAWMAEQQQQAALPVLERNLLALDLPIRTYITLGLAGARRVRDVCACTPAELLSIHGFGKAALRAVEERLAEHGLRLDEVGDD